MAGWWVALPEWKIPTGEMTSVPSRSDRSLLPTTLWCVKSIWGPESGVKGDRSGRGIFPLPPNRELVSVQVGGLANSRHEKGVARLKG